MKKIFILGTFALASSLVYSQEYPVSYGFIQDCGGFLVDNGLSASDYGPNENSTTTICPDGTDDPIVNLYFASFNLGTGDQLSIYDGSDTSAPLIGTYEGTSLQAQDVTSSSGNLSGCLTVVFTSDSDANVGSFGSEISCGLPCARPFAIVSTNQLDANPTRICIGEEISFDASASTFAEGASLNNFTWNFDDGTTNTSDWPIVTHSFPEPGAYVVQIALTDDNDCSSANLPDVLVFVATEPDMTLNADDYLVCVGQTVDISGNATPVQWSALPDANFGGALYIPDDQSQCFSSELVFGGFQPGATIETATDLASFFINFEHTFMGDLTISFICPNGTSLIVHQQNGGGMHLGSSNEADDPNLPGTGWDYYWSSTTTNPTWADAALDPNFTEPNSNGIESLSPGTYASIQPFSTLIGCPLNGAWTVEVCDLWGADDGFIFDWSVQFALELYPDLIAFTPSIGAGCDSTYWSGQFISNIDAGCDNMTVVPATPGSYIYTYTAIDNHGCTYTDDLTIEAYPGPIASAGNDMPYCGTPITLFGGVTNPVVGINYTYGWTPTNPLNNGSIPSPTVGVLTENTDFVLSIYPSDDPQCIVTDTVSVFIPLVPPSGPIDSLELCAGGRYPLEAPIDDTDIFSYIWTYSTSEGGPFETVQEEGAVYQASQDGYYWLQITEPICGFTSQTPYYVDVISCEIIIPNIFTPNGDGENDSFQVLGLENFPKSTLVVYNRWGAKVYESDNYRNNWSPRDISEGTYFFVVGIRKSNGEFDYHEGHVTLLRK